MTTNGEPVARRELEALDRIVSERWLEHGKQHAAEDRVAEQTRENLEVRILAMSQNLQALERWRSRVTGASAVLALIAGVIGAAVVKALGG